MRHPIFASSFIHLLLLIGMLYSNVAAAAHLPPGREVAVQALIVGPEVAVMGLQLGNIAIGDGGIVVQVRSMPEHVQGTLRLQPRGTGQGVLLASASFDLVWSGVAPASTTLRTWAAAIAARDRGGWWLEDASPAPRAASPRLPWSLLLAAVAWQLALSLAMLALLLAPSGWGGWRVPAWTALGALLGAEAAWSTGHAAASAGQMAAIVGRSCGPWDALAAVVRWQFHVPESWVGAIVAGLTVALLGAGTAATAGRWRDSLGAISAELLPLVAVLCALSAVVLG